MAQDSTHNHVGTPSSGKAAHPAANTDEGTSAAGSAGATVGRNDAETLSSGSPAGRQATRRATAANTAGRGDAAGPWPKPGADLRDLEVLADWLDTRFRLPGTRIRFGLDSILGLVPGVGDAVTTVPAAYMLLRAHQMGVPRSVLVRMGWNVAMDLMVGAIPLVGDLFDLGFKANRRNVALLRQHFGQPPASPLRDPVQGPI